MPRPRRPELALAIGNLGAPGGLTRSVVLSLGAGLSLLVTVALVDRSIVAELTGRLPEDSPNYFVLDIKRAESDAFHALVTREAPAAKVQRGADAARPSGQARRSAGRAGQGAARGAMGAQRRSRPHLLREPCPRARRWWPGNGGRPTTPASRWSPSRPTSPRGCGLKIGDTVTVNVLGRNVTARIANLREVKWESLSLNFVLVFSPNTLAGAPHNLLATVTLPKDAPLAAEAKLAQQIGRAFPAIDGHPRKGRHRCLQRHFQSRHGGRAGGRQRHAVGGRPGAGRRLGDGPAPPHPAGGDPQDPGRHAPAHPAVAFAEYLVLALLTSFIALLIGGLAAWITVSRVMDFDFVFSGRAAAEAMLLAIGWLRCLAALAHGAC